MTNKTKKTFKIVTGIIVFLTLPSLLFFGFVYFKYNQDLPVGVPSKQADVLAENMLKALNFEAYKSTNYIEWTFKKRHHYKWYKNIDMCTVLWKDYKVSLDLKNPSQSKVYVHNFKTEGEKATGLIATALKYFNNDSFWLVAPYEVFDTGVERAIVKDEHGNNALLVTYKHGKSTPNGSYLWLLDTDGKPTGFKMWTSTIPLGGLEASWNHWTTAESGTILPTFHKIFFFGFEIDHIKGTK